MSMGEDNTLIQRVHDDTRVECVEKTRRVIIDQIPSETPNAYGLPRRSDLKKNSQSV